MSDLTKMWIALERYQPYADEDGHGESWKRMTIERTAEATKSAADVAWEDAWNAGRSVWEAPYVAAMFAARAVSSAEPERFANRAIEEITRAMEDYL